MLALMIIGLLCLGLLFSTLAAAHGYSKKLNQVNPSTNRLYMFFYALIIFASVALVILYIK